MRRYSILAASMFWATVAFADRLTTPALLADPTSTATCVTINIWSQAVDVSVELRDDTNAVVASTDCPGLPGNHSCSVSAPSRSGVVFCDATAPTRAAIRLTLMMVDGNGRVTSSVVARRED